MSGIRTSHHIIREAWVKRSTVVAWGKKVITQLTDPARSPWSVVKIYYENSCWGWNQARSKLWSQRSEERPYPILFVLGNLIALLVILGRASKKGGSAKQDSIWSMPWKKIRKRGRPPDLGQAGQVWQPSLIDHSVGESLEGTHQVWRTLGFGSS